MSKEKLLLLLRIVSRNAWQNYWREGTYDNDEKDDCRLLEGWINELEQEEGEMINET